MGGDVAVDDGGAAADSGGEGGLLETFEDGCGEVCWIDVVGVELREGEEVGGDVVDHLGVGGVGLDELGIGEGLCEEVDGVEDGLTGGRAVVIERDVLALCELGQRDEGLQGEGLIVDGPLVAGHLLRECAAWIELVDALFVDGDAPVEEVVV